MPLRFFLQRFKPFLLIDDIQYAPHLFPYIKSIVDKEEKTGLFWLTGSQQFLLMKNIIKSLAGRVGILQLQGLSQDEKCGSKSIPFLPTKEYVFEKSNGSRNPMYHSDMCEVYHQTWKDSYLHLWTRDDAFWDAFYNLYVQTYIERDVRSFLNVEMSWILCVL